MSHTTDLLRLLAAVERQKQSAPSPGETLAEAELWSLALEIQNNLAAQERAEAEAAAKNGEGPLTPNPHFYDEP